MKVRKVLGLGLLCFMVACDATSPRDELTIRIGFIAPAGTSFTATLDGHSYREAGSHALVVKSGTSYEMTGTFTGAALGVTFTGIAAAARGGVEAGSVESLEGPAAFVNACDISFLPPDPGTYNFRIRFRTTSSIGDAFCFILL